MHPLCAVAHVKTADASDVNKPQPAPRPSLSVGVTLTQVGVPLTAGTRPGLKAKC